jgi:hypothetical protein
MQNYVFATRWGARPSRALPSASRRRLDASHSRVVTASPFVIRASSFLGVSDFGIRHCSGGPRRFAIHSPPPGNETFETETDISKAIFLTNQQTFLRRVSFSHHRAPPNPGLNRNPNFPRLASSPSILPASAGKECDHYATKMQPKTRMSLFYSRGINHLQFRPAKVVAFL